MSFKITVPEKVNLTFGNSFFLRKQISNPKEIEEMVFEEWNQAYRYLLTRFGGANINHFTIKEIK